jgi:DNA-binding beta-propeller fold protein YncE
MPDNDNTEQTGLIGRIQQLPQLARVAIFFAGVALVVAALFGLTGFLYLQQVTNIARTEPVSMQEGSVTVEEFITLDDADAYPGALAVAPDGTLYTGSFASGALWATSPDGTVSEVAGSRETLGSISGLDVAMDGTLYILDRLHPLESRGADIYRLLDGTLEQIRSFPARGENEVLSANDIAVDAQGRVYLVDLGGAVVWQIDPAGDTVRRWWQPQADDQSTYALAGIAYDAASGQILVTNATANTIHALPVADDNPQATTLYTYTGDTQAPGFNGLSTGADGEIYVAALGTNRVARLNLESGDLTYLAGAFRGSSDVAYDVERERLYVNNWDQRSLLPVQFLFLEIDIDPRLPFSVDVVTFMDDTAADAESTPDTAETTDS